MPNKPDPRRRLSRAITELLNNAAYEGLDPSVKATLATEAVWGWAMKQSGETPQKGKPWSDDSLRVVLQSAPTHENIVRLARAFGRSPGSVEQIFRWAATSDKRVKEVRPDDSFIQQIKRVAKEVGWEAF